MPNIDDLMQEWPADFEEMLKEVNSRGGNCNFFLHVLRTGAEKNYLSEELSAFPLGNFFYIFLYIF